MIHFHFGLQQCIHKVLFYNLLKNLHRENSYIILRQVDQCMDILSLTYPEYFFWRCLIPVIILKKNRSPWIKRVRRMNLIQISHQQHNKNINGLGIRQNNFNVLPSAIQ